ncbi:SPOR domain-containing protein [Alteromonas genovensis]|uniref:SPOR domain-containing protein n=1 Tax=Alteromonas genovensis TaxID=471225 RepID=A0A6N9TJ28_9ALTE|nr:SPOR domain-containing protein [Alteromonas sp.]MAI37177.1 dedD protein [Alteromonas sp.]NDW16105.1 SPOR domain-containing protein [Alteromonas genovensis]OUX89421.1 MAG: dedD protein [Alteromonas sp. TMED35]
MTSALKNRLVGTIIIVALAVIFLPDFLDGKKQTNREPFVSVPANPPIKPIVEPEPFPSERVARAAVPEVEVEEAEALDDVYESQEKTELQASELQASDDTQTTSTSPEPKDELASQTVIEASNDLAEEDAGWVIQLGSFRHEKNVKSLLAKLERAGYRAFSRKIQTSSGLLNKVFVGPDLDKQKLESALPHLKELTKLKGKVTTFKVE